MRVKKVEPPLLRILYTRSSKEAALKVRDTVEASSGHTGKSHYGVLPVGGGDWAVIAVPRERAERMAQRHWIGPNSGGG